MSSQEVAKKYLVNSPASSLNILDTIVRYQNQKIDIDTIYRVYSDFTSYTCTHLCVCIGVCAWVWYMWFHHIYSLA